MGHIRISVFQIPWHVQVRNKKIGNNWVENKDKFFLRRNLAYFCAFSLQRVGPLQKHRDPLRTALVIALNLNCHTTSSGTNENPSKAPNIDFAKTLWQAATSSINMAEPRNWYSKKDAQEETVSERSRSSHFIIWPPFCFSSKIAPVFHFSFYGIRFIELAQMSSTIKGG